MYDTPYWRIWTDLARDHYQGRRPRWLWKRLFIWWDSFAK